MGIEWGGKGPEQRIKSPEPHGRYERLFQIATKSALERETPETNVTETHPETDLTTDQMLDLMAPAPKDPPKSLRTLE